MSSGDFLKDIGGPIVSTVGSIFGANKESGAAVQAAQIQAKAAQQAAEMQAQAAQQALQFQQQQDAQAQKNYTDTTAFNRGVYNTQQANLAPYRAIGVGSLADLARPIGQ